MELGRQLENNDWKWKAEKMELLERFDNERKEWECQWKMMQKKIEELYQEVKLRREKNLNGDDGNIQEKMILLSTPISQNEPSKPMNVERQSHQNNMVGMELDKNCKMLVNDCPISNKGNKSELKISNKKHEVCKTESEKWLAQRMSKTENDTLNDALKEIARVSEELCKYQEEIRTKSHCKRTVPEPGEGVSKNKLHIKPDRKPIHSSRLSRFKQDNRVSSGKSKSTQSISSTLTCNSNTAVTPLVSQDTALSSWEFSLDIANSVFPDMNKKSAVNENQCSTAFEDQICDFSLNNYNDGLCHVQWLCDIGSLEDGILTETLFTNLTKVSSSTPEMKKQNISVSQNELFHSIGLNPDLMVSGHSTAGSGYNYANTIKNGKLAAKIDEFNRTVFKAGKGNSVSDELLDVDMEEKPSILLKCESPTIEKDKSPINILKTSDQTCTSGSFHNITKTVAPSAPPIQAATPPITSSFQNVLQEHNWKRFNLSGRPRSADSRSNYGVVEKLLKSYETKSTTSVCISKQSQSKWTKSDFLLTNKNSDSLNRCLERLHLEPTAHVSQNDIHWQSRLDAVGLKLPEILPTSSSNEKGFSRPARPANQRPPSRWASAKSPSMSPPVRRATH